MLLVSAVLFASSVFVCRAGLVKGYLGAAFFGLCLLITVVQLHPKASFLNLTTEGFTFTSLFSCHFVRWADVQEFGVIQIRRHRMVVWNCIPERAPASRMREISKALSNFDAGLPDTYGMQPQELADLLNYLRSEHGDSLNG